MVNRQQRVAGDAGARVTRTLAATPGAAPKRPNCSGLCKAKR